MRVHLDIVIIVDIGVYEMIGIVAKAVAVFKIRAKLVIFKLFGKHDLYPFDYILLENDILLLLFYHNVCYNASVKLFFFRRIDYAEIKP